MGRLRRNFFFLNNLVCVQAHISLFENPPMLSQGMPYPVEYLEPLKSLWNDKAIQETFSRGNTFALNDNVI